MQSDIFPGSTREACSYGTPLGPRHGYLYPNRLFKPGLSNSGSNLEIESRSSNFCMRIEILRIGKIM